MLILRAKIASNAVICMTLFIFSLIMESWLLRKVGFCRLFLQFIDWLKNASQIRWNKIRAILNNNSKITTYLSNLICCSKFTLALDLWNFNEQSSVLQPLTFLKYIQLRSFWTFFRKKASVLKTYTLLLLVACVFCCIRLGLTKWFEKGILIITSIKLHHSNWWNSIVHPKLAVLLLF